MRSPRPVSAPARRFQARALRCNELPHRLTAFSRLYGVMPITASQVELRYELCSRSGTTGETTGAAPHSGGERLCGA
jgi:hypothetical protein